jgi:ABC-type nitrate/sulfonate/bicarbonate transport system substrate-binding protein
MAINADFLAKRPELVQEIVGVVVRSTDEYNRDRSKWIADLKLRPDFRPEVVQTGVEHVLLDWNLYLDRTKKLAASMKELGFIRAVPDDAKLAKYFRYDFLTKATGQSDAQVGRTK